MDNVSVSKNEVEKLLKLLSVKGRCCLRQTAYALYLVVKDKNYLSHITKGLYQDVAQKYRTNWRNVERNIRGARDMVWKDGRELLEKMAGKGLDTRPSNTEFLSILAEYLECTNEAAAALDIVVGTPDMLVIRRITDLERTVCNLQNRVELLERAKDSAKE